MPRLFTAIEIPAEVAQSLTFLRGGLPGARWIDPENYHITLRFIGDVDIRVAHDVASILDRVSRAAFELRLDGVSSFGGRKPRAVFANVASSQALMDLQAEHERLMQRVGLEPLHAIRSAADLIWSKRIIRWKSPPRAGRFEYLRKPRDLMTQHLR